VTISILEPLSERDERYLAEAERAFGIRVQRQGAPSGNERALIVEHRDVSLADLDIMRDLQIIYLFEWGRALLPLNRLDARGITVRKVVNLSGLGVAEHVFALLLALRKQIVHGHSAVTNNLWREGVTEPVFTDQRAHTFNWSGIENIGWLYGETLGIIGFGRIGKAIAQRARAFDMNVLYYNRHRLSSVEEARLEVEYAEVDDLVERADVITLNLPYTPQSASIIGRDQIERMKPTAVLINTARGRVVDEDALTDALREHRIAGAGLDVMVYEPPARENPLLQFDNVVFSPHVAGIYDPVAREIQFKTALRWWLDERNLS
jgi:lactate dehydrogenase-like 2-hydroxyacid dehydrogenase